MAVSCADGPDVSRRDLSDWAFRPKYKFEGPFGMPEASGDGSGPEEGRPAAPILFLSNRWDPVTPPAHARVVMDSFPGAGLVVQESTGHCATLGAIGPCVRDIMAEYFATGAVPEEEVTCEATRGIWDD